MWACLYELCLLFNPYALILGLPFAVDRSHPEHASVVYFSLSMLTTLGAGDIAPKSNLRASLLILKQQRQPSSYCSAYQQTRRFAGVCLAK